MSSCNRLPRRTKFATVQHGLQRVTVRNRDAVGCPKVLEIWVPIGVWSSNAHEVVEKAYEACKLVHGIDRQVLYVET